MIYFQYSWVFLFLHYAVFQYFQTLQVQFTSLFSLHGYSCFFTTQYFNIFNRCKCSSHHYFLSNCKKVVFVRSDFFIIFISFNSRCFCYFRFLRTQTSMVFFLLTTINAYFVLKLTFFC